MFNLISSSIICLVARIIISMAFVTWYFGPHFQDPWKPNLSCKGESINLNSHFKLGHVYIRVLKNFEDRQFFFSILAIVSKLPIGTNNRSYGMYLLHSC